MKPYKVIQGSSENLAMFEDAVSAALEEGYELAGRLTTKVVTNSNGTSNALFFQPMIFEEILEEIYEEDDETEL